MTKRNLFYLFYYSQFPLVFLSGLLTASISMVINSQVNWSVILLISLSTYLTYSIDNLIDWKRDRKQYVRIQTLIKTYHKFTYFILPITTALIIFLVLRGSNEFLIAILLLGAAAAMGTTRFSKYRFNSSDPKQPIRVFFLNRLFITLVWTTVCVFIPIWYENLQIRVLTWHTYFYIFSLIFVYAIIWKLERSPERLKKKLFQFRQLRFILLFPIFSMIIVFLDTYTGIRPLHNLINLLPPTVCLIGACRITKFPFMLRQKISWWMLGFLLSILFSISISLIY